MALKQLAEMCRMQSNRKKCEVLHLQVKMKDTNTRWEKYSLAIMPVEKI